MVTLLPLQKLWFYREDSLKNTKLAGLCCTYKCAILTPLHIIVNYCCTSVMHIILTIQISDIMCRSKRSLWPHQTVTEYIEKWQNVLFQVTMMEHCLHLMRWCQFWNMLGSHHQVFTVILCTGMQCTFYCLVAHHAHNFNVGCWPGLPKWSILCRMRNLVLYTSSIVCSCLSCCV